MNFVPKDIEQYALSHTTKESDLLESLARETAEKTDMAEMLVGPLEGTFLKVLAGAVQAKRILEIGTFTGYSALLMAEVLPEDGELITLDVSEFSTEIAKRYWQQSNHGKKIKSILGPATETLQEIEGPFDLVFIDADKPNYTTYWESVVPKVRRSGLIVVDNVLWGGAVLNPETEDDKGISKFNEYILQDHRVEHVMLPVRDGITVALKR